MKQKLRVVLLVGAAAVTSLAAPPVHEWLSHPLLDPLQPEIEARIYVGSHVATLPAFSSADEWTRYADALRTRVLDEIVFRGEARKWRDAPARVEWLDAIEAGDYHIRKLRYEAVPGLWIPALLYEPARLSGKTAAVLNLNGHEPEGKAEEHWQINCINQAKRGMIALKPDWIGTGQLRAMAHGEANQIDLCGASGEAVFFLAMSRALDLLAAYPPVDSERIAVTGLSGGGWQTIFISSLDRRVALANPVAGYSSFITRSQFPEPDLGDSEQTPADLATIADYTHLTALLAPRWALITNNAKDSCCFRADYAPAPLLDAAAPLYRLLGKPERLSHHTGFDPGHNYARSNREAFYASLKRAFYPNDPSFSDREIDCRKYLRSAEELTVPLPSENGSLHGIAVSLMADLPRTGRFATPEAARQKLAALVRFHELPAAWRETASAEIGGVNERSYRVELGGDWTVPAVVLAPAPANGQTVVMLADDGRESLYGAAAKALAAGATVIAVDPINFGENRIAQRTYLYSLALATVGERMLGLEVSEIAALAASAPGRAGGTVTVEAFGPRASLALLVTAALKVGRMDHVRLHGSRAYLKDLIRQNITVEQEPESFCFGLLEFFDIPELRAMAGPIEDLPMP